MGTELLQWRSEMKPDGSIRMETGSFQMEMRSILMVPSRAGAGLHPQPG